MKTTLLLILFLSISVLGISQSTESQAKPKFTPLIKPNTIAFTGTFEGEFIVNYERLIGRSLAIELGFGKKWPQQPDHLLDKEPTSDHSNVTAKYINMYSGYLGSISFRKYLDVPKHPVYLSLGITYKNYSYDHVKVMYDNNELGGPNYCEIVSGKKQVVAGKLLIGEKFNFKINPKVNFILDVYTGVGFRGKFYEDEILAQGTGNYGTDINNCNCTPLANPTHKNTSVYIPSVQLGLKVGIGF